MATFKGHCADSRGHSISSSTAHLNAHAFMVLKWYPLRRAKPVFRRIYQGRLYWNWIHSNCLQNQVHHSTASL